LSKATPDFFITLRQIMARMKSLIILLLSLLLLNACARVGRPSGGDKDVTPPKLLSVYPNNNATGFQGQEIVLNFDEYVVLKDPGKNILISPPLKNMPVFKPTGIASKIFKIQFKDRLLPNTTYLINFGQSIADYNEGNQLKNLQIVFSTGTSIDSIKLKGQVKALHYKKQPESIILGLYPYKTFKDSMVFNTKPYYVSLADKSGNFELSHLKSGKYFLVALEDKNGDYKYKQGDEGIGYLLKSVDIPNDSVVSINLFKEYPPLSIESITQKTKNLIELKFKGNPDSLKIQWHIPIAKEARIVNNDLLQLWYQTTSDSVKFSIPLKNRLKKFNRKRTEKENDSLLVNIKKKGVVNPDDTIKISGNQALTEYDQDKIRLTEDSLKIPFKIETHQSVLNILFDKKLGKKYLLKLLPGAVTGFTGAKNKDTITGKIPLPKAEKYGKLFVHLNNQKKKLVFIEIIKNGKLIKKTPTQTGNDFEIKYLLPAKYRLRIIFDQNKNNHWDAGNYLKHIPPEAIFEPDLPVEIRANWDVNQTYNIKDLQ